MALPSSHSTSGSSPRAWVLGGTAGRRRGVLRFIPTCVGLGPRPGWPWRATSVHPHVRGSWTHTAPSGTSPVGSSPRAWVLAGRRPRRGSAARFIPTCVGLGPAHVRNRLSPPVHPHVRGSWMRRFRQPASPGGSSPRAWVLAFVKATGTSPDRFIPTCVGLGAGRGRCVRGAAVHPHVRGSWSRSRSMCPRCGGSSPRAWVLVGVDRRELD